MQKECLLLDVFTSTPFTGNQLAVFPDAEELTAERMQLLAREINYSETVFILPATEPGADFRIRIFTPRAELPFAGHPTLGTACALLNYLDTPLQGRENIKLQTGVGVIPLKKEGDLLWMQQNEPEFFSTYQEHSEIAAMVGLHLEDLDPRWPCEEVSTGNAILMIPVKNLEAMGRAGGNQNLLGDFFSRANSMLPYLFTLETCDPACRVHTRLFAPHFGIIEDPATGSAAGPLSAYLLKHNVFGDHFSLQNEQGLELGRPSRLHMRGSLEAGVYRIEVGGCACLSGMSSFYLSAASV